MGTVWGSLKSGNRAGVHVKASLVKAAKRNGALRKAQSLLTPPSGQVWRNYYILGSVRIAMRVQVNGVGDKVYYLLTDHLGSTAITVDVNGSKQAEMRYKPWGETRYSDGNTPTDYRYTGQREEAGIGLYFYQSRFYDANLGRFAQADSYVSGGGQGLDRYAYVFNSPVMYTDPSGYKACENFSNGKCEVDMAWQDQKSPLEHAEYQIRQAGYEPEAGCSSNPICADSYNTFVEVVITLRRVPTMEEILYMTAGVEYYPYAGYSGVRAIGQEGLARNYYSACGIDGCSGNELYTFMAGYQPWYGDPDVMYDGSASARASHLVNDGLRNDFAGTGVNLRTEVSQITNLGIATGKGWTNGRDPNKSWQWFGPFYLNPSKEPSYGNGPNNDAILVVDLGNDMVFWMVTGAQDKKFHQDDWK